MIQFGETIFYIDVEAFRNCILSEDSKNIGKNTSTEITKHHDHNGGLLSWDERIIQTEKDVELDSSKYDLMSRMIDVVLTYDSEDLDTSLGYERALDKASLPFKIAFNTLLNYGIIKEKE
jgi:hypothetical protein